MLNQFIQKMSLSVRQAGVLAKNLQGRVENEPKKQVHKPGDSKRTKAQREAKTVIDETVQEILLQTALEIFKPDEITLDAEEDTPLKKLFKLQKSELTLIIDPIDGTIEYLSGTDAYSVCVGLAYSGVMQSAMVYFPVRDHFYYINGQGAGCLAVDAYKNGLNNGQLIEINKPVTPNIYYHHNIGQSIISKMENIEGITVINREKTGLEWPEAFIRCMNGEISAVILENPHPRDLLLGAILVSSGGYAIDRTGETLQWPQYGRIPFVIFGNGVINPEILSIFNEK